MDRRRASIFQSSAQQRRSVDVITSDVIHFGDSAWVIHPNNFGLASSENVIGERSRPSKILINTRVWCAARSAAEPKYLLVDQR